MIIPYDDINPTQKTPYLTYAIIALNILGFIYALEWLRLPPEEQMIALRQNGSLIPSNLEALDFLTSMFLHGGLSHLAGNMLFLWITGDNIEDEFGRIPYLIFYLFAGIAAALTHVISAPGSSVPVVGASGAISGVMGAYIVLYPHSRIKIFYWLYFFIGNTRIKAFWWLGLWFGFQVLSGASASPGGGGVAYGAHIGGFVVGAGVAFVAKTAGWVDGEVTPGGSGPSRRHFR